MIRSKEKWQLRRQVGPYYISTINFMTVEKYKLEKEFCKKYGYNFFEVMKWKKEFQGWYETMVSNGKDWIEQIRYNSKYRALQGHREMIEQYENLYNNSKEEQPEIPWQKSKVLRE